MTNTTTRANAHTNFSPPEPVRGRASSQPKRWLTAIAISALALSPVVVGAETAIASGDPACGPLADGVHQVSTVAQLEEVGSAGAGTGECQLGASYAQTVSLTLPAPVAPATSNWTPIGSSATPFTGTFNGNGHTITGLTITSSSSHQGMFAQTNSATLKNIGLINVSVTGDSDVGGLVGENGGTITNSSATGEVTGDNDVGGLVGDNEGGTITNSYATGAVKATSFDGGGLVGENGGTITNSYATGEVTGDTDVGGLVGDNDGAITNSYATGAVKATSFDGGGLVGENGGTITNSYATGEVTGDNDVGGLVGDNDDTHGFGTITNSYATGAVKATGSDVGGLVGYNVEGTITNSYATGEVTGNSDVGGLVGDNEGGTITNSYATGAVKATGSDVGGLVGENDGGTITDSFWDTTTSLQGTSAGGTGKTTAQMQTLSTYTNTSTAGLTTAWKMVAATALGEPGGTDADPDEIWGLGSGVNCGYPFLWWQASSSPCPTPARDSGSSATSAGTPGIFLHITGPVGRSVAGSPVYYGADRVQVTSTYTLTLTPVGGNRPPVTMLAEGTIELNGSFATSVRLDPLAPGSYDVQFTGTHQNGATLELTSRIVVGPGGEYMLIGDNIPIIR